jgi:hypothetical protein
LRQRLAGQTTRVDARHLQGADEGVELVVLDGDAAAEGRLEGAGVGRGDGAPADRVEKGLQAGGIVEAVVRRAGESRSLRKDRDARLDLPEHGELLAEGIVFDRRELDQMRGGGALARERGSHDVRDDPVAVAHAHELAHFRGRSQGPRRSDWHGGGRDSTTGRPRTAQA